MRWKVKFRTIVYRCWSGPGLSSEPNLTPRDGLLWFTFEACKHSIAVYVHCHLRFGCEIASRSPPVQVRDLFPDETKTSLFPQHSLTSMLNVKRLASLFSAHEHEAVLRVPSVVALRSPQGWTVAVRRDASWLSTHFGRVCVSLLIRFTD